MDCLMTSLASKVKTPTIFLLGAGIIMALALWTSKKARTVTKTELSLSKQDEGSKCLSIVWPCQSNGKNQAYPDIQVL